MESGIDSVNGVRYQLLNSAPTSAILQAVSRLTKRVCFHATVAGEVNKYICSCQYMKLTLQTLHPDYYKSNTASQLSLRIFMYGLHVCGWK